MKKILSLILSMLLAVGMIGSVPVFAEETEAPAIIDVENADSAPDDGSYTLVDDGETVLEVVHVDSPGVTALGDRTAGGYYTAEFMIPDTNDQVFLTGLTQDQVNEIRQAITDSYAAGSDMELKNLGFIDTEKTWTQDGDDNLCWAAASSNILTYTGWAAQAKFSSTDDVFEDYIKNFTDAAGSPYYGFGWFFNGISAPSGFAQLKNADSGNYLSSYFFAEYLEMQRFYQSASSLTAKTAAENMKELEERLRRGCGVSLGVDIYSDGENQGGHSITCWGLVTDTRYSSDVTEHYRSVFITDSDSDKYFVQNGKDRREADDVMSLFAIEHYVQDSFDTFRFEIGDGQTAFIKEAISLEPYSAGLSEETEEKATCNPRTTADMSVRPFLLSDDNSIERTQTKFAVGSSVYYCPYFTNDSSVSYSGSFLVKITVTNAQGQQIYSRNLNAGTQTVAASTSMAFGYLQIPSTVNLPAGDYTITAQFNPNRDTTEAYYYNNTASVSFTVSESYRLGDADGDGTVRISDASTIQRILAHYDSADDQARMRGDINQSGSLDILDVTLIQRYLAHITIYFPIDIVQIYD